MASPQPEDPRPATIVAAARLAMHNMADAMPAELKKGYRVTVARPICK